MSPEPAPKAGRVSFLVTCLADQFYPEAAEAAVRALRRCGVRADCPAGQTCCGLPHYNNGYRDEARRLARRNLDLFEGDLPIVVPSGSCGWMCKSVYPSLFEDDPWLRARALRFSDRTFELSAFLAARQDGGKAEAAPEAAGGLGKVAYHDSCHALRGLGLRDGPRNLLSRLAGVEVVELPGADRCCGFGGSFAVKFDEVSAAILKEKLEAARACGADALVTADAGCLMQLRGGAGRWKEMGLSGPPPRVLHLAEVLAPPGQEHPSPPPRPETSEGEGHAR